MTGVIAEIVTTVITGERGMGKYTGSRLSPTHDEIAQLAFIFTNAWPAGRTPRRRLVACGTGTRGALRLICEALTNTRDTLKTRAIKRED